MATILKTLAYEEIAKDPLALLLKSYKTSIKLPIKISEELLHYINERDLGITENHLRIFKIIDCQFTRIILQGNKLIDYNCFELFQGKHIESLEIDNLACSNFKWLEYIESNHLKALKISRGKVALATMYNDTFLSRHIVHLKNIVDLNVSWCYITNESLNDFALNLINLETLNLSFNNVNNFAPLSKLKKLHTLDCSMKISFWSCDTFSSLLTLENIKKMIVSTEVSGSHDLELDDFLNHAKYSQIKSLDIHGYFIKDEGNLV
ncbi:unnamed protein product [Dimorphilus gyrociliatus]|uniref:Uncharacterized protein n=1 Tax=Dimorphilus gyrociliatus TaxID=2664684 RepID=A0A7I8VWU3_9ANNE|nr:unnamed protein product [Dimorphilus gyrociliatus]